MPPARLILIPGMGVDARLFHLQRNDFPHLEVPAWITPEPRETLPHYGQRLAELVLRGDAVPEGHPKPSPDAPIVLGGLSLGGMLALEMSKHMPVSRLVLIASCMERSAISPLLKLSELSSRLAPMQLLQWAKSFGPAFVGLGGVPPDQRQLLGRMLLDLPIEFVRWAARATMEWEGVPQVSVPLHHAQGTRDWVIPISRLSKPPTLIIEGGAHVLSMSHPKEINTLLRTAQSEASRERGEPQP